MHHWTRGIKGLDFGDLDLISKVTGDIRISDLDQKRFICILSRETIDVFLLNSHGYFIGYLKETNTLSNERGMHFVTGGAERFNDCLNTLRTYVMNIVYILCFSPRYYYLEWTDADRSLFKYILSNDGEILYTLLPRGYF